jgi:hypothetical protein
MQKQAGAGRVELELSGRRVKAGEKRWLQHDDGDLRAGMGRWPARLGLASIRRWMGRLLGRWLAATTATTTNETRLCAARGRRAPVAQRGSVQGAACSEQRAAIH